MIERERAQSEVTVASIINDGDSVAERIVGASCIRLTFALRAHSLSPVVPFFHYLSCREREGPPIRL